MTLEDMAKDGYKSHVGEIGYNDETTDKLYFDGFKDGVNIVLDKFKEIRLKEVESQFIKILDGLSSWKTDSKEKIGKQVKLGTKVERVMLEIKRAYRKGALTMFKYIADYIHQFRQLPQLEGDLHIFWKKFHELND